MTPWHLREAIRHITAGGIIAYPTETVYGLGCDPFNGAAVLRLLELKQRRVENGVILISSDLSQLEPLLLPLNSIVKQRIMKTRTHPVTWILPCLPEIPVWLRGKHETLAVRVTSHPGVKSLCERWGGPLVSTSANIHGRHPAVNALTVRRAFNDSLDYILHASTGNTGKPSEIRDGITGRILRRG